jgi:predicted DNA-binding transcriptional regulator YafY
MRLYKNGLYLVTYSHRAKAYRLFAVERIRRVELTQENFTIGRDFSAAKLNESFGLVDEPAQTIRIRFAAHVADFLKEREWHPTQSIEDLADGAVIFTMHAGGLEEIVSWVLSWGETAQVLAPPALIDAIVGRLTAAREQYSAKSR